VDAWQQIPDDHSAATSALDQQRVAGFTSARTASQQDGIP
jgi:hypothetical protein